MTGVIDVVIIGAGHNGLTAAAYLARAGKSVTVLEQRHVIGGCTATEEIFPGCRVDLGPSTVGHLPADMVQDLQLTHHGLDLIPCDPSVFAPQPDGSHLQLFPDAARTRASIAAVSAEDADRYDGFARLVHLTCGILEAAYQLTPPDPVAGGARDLMSLAQLGGKLRRLGKREMTEVLRVLPMTAQELLDEWFTSDALQGVLAASAIQGIFQGPMSAGTAFNFFHQHVGAPLGAIRSSHLIRGGSGKLADALAASAVQHGANVRTNMTVDQILIDDNGSVVGVALSSGDELRARVVVSSAAPAHSLGTLLPPGELEPTARRAVSNIRYRGAAARVDLLLRDVPTFNAIPRAGQHLNGVISISPGIEYLERAYDAAKHGGISPHPHIEATIPTILNPERADGHHVMSMLVQFAPYALADAEWNDETRKQVADRAVNTLAEYAPDLSGLIEDQRIMTPADLETELALPEGNMYHGEMALDQLLFMRPVPTAARYASPIDGLYLCGAGSHPGGGVHGRAGRNAAREILKAL